MRQVLAVAMGVLALTACQPDAAFNAAGVQPTQPPAPPTAVAVALQPSVTPFIIPTVGEGVVELPPITDEAAFVVVTPTPGPSKTPSQTPTPPPTNTPSPAPSASFTPRATNTPLVFPTRVSTAIPTVATFPAAAYVPPELVNPLLQQAGAVGPGAGRVCSQPFFFNDRGRAGSCPGGTPSQSQAVYQDFERGLMMWLSSDSRIYVIYDDAGAPRWQSFADTYQEGMPETDANWSEPKPPYGSQPRRGFGEVWRNNADVRGRVGWATQDFEYVYTATIQAGDDGSVFISIHNGSVYELQPNGAAWSLHLG